MLEKAEKEVESVEAKREIAIARSGFRAIKAELKSAMVDDETVRDAIRLADQCNQPELSARLEKFLEVDPADDQDDYRVELIDSRWKASVVISGKTYQLGSYGDPQVAVDVIDEFTTAFDMNRD